MLDEKLSPLTVALQMVREQLATGAIVPMQGFGISMEPTISSGDVVEIVAPNDLKIGDIVVVDYGRGLLVVHRIIAFHQYGERTIVETKGDNKPESEQAPIEYVLGRVVSINGKKI
ncbi:MAG: signal peptidase I [Firmicutes bacterium]|nr:signal peptidase I [Bacillota bacterium]